MANSQRFFVLCAAILSLIAASNGLPVKKSSPAENARYAMSQTSWVSIATISTIKEVKDYPMVNVKSTADAGTGIPYLYFSDLDLSVIDINANPRASILATLADGECAEQSLDPQDPRCPRLILTGKIVRVEDEEEAAVAKAALLKKHPAIEEWETAHKFYVTKLNIERITFLDHFGGADIIDPKEYLAVKF